MKNVRFQEITESVSALVEAAKALAVTERLHHEGLCAESEILSARGTLLLQQATVIREIENLESALYDAQDAAKTRMGA